MLFYNEDDVKAYLDRFAIPTFSSTMALGRPLLICSMASVFVSMCRHCARRRSRKPGAECYLLDSEEFSMTGQ